MERPPEHKTLWVAYALHLSGGCMIGLHRIYLGKTEMVPYMILWLVIAMIAIVASPVGSYVFNAYLVFIYFDLIFIPGMLKRKNAELDAAYERRIAERD